MQILQGIAVSPGVVVGEALILDNETHRIPQRFLPLEAAGTEKERWDRALETVGRELERRRDAVSRELGEQYGAIFSAHEALLRDPKLRREIEHLITARRYSAEYAASRTLRRYAKVLESLDKGAFAQRAQDLYDLEQQLLAALLGKRREALSQLDRPAVLLAHNLTPSETASLDRKNVLGFVTEAGGLGGHTAIVAEALGIPAVVGAGAFLSDVSSGETIIVDGDEGRVILQPDEAALAKYRREAEQHRTHEAQLAGLSQTPAVTTDGVRIELLANVEFPDEVEACLARGADGIGLYRTEFLHLGAERIPDEEEHFRVYSHAVRALNGKAVVIRTLDLGADKLEPGVLEERNPFLGLRSIRLSLRNLPLFRTQLRAILRVSALGPVEVMFPLITTLDELRQAKMVLTDLMEDLAEEGLPFDRSLPVGMMVETPAAVTMLDRFLPEVDFLSIGTNDLIQYVLAVDRSNPAVSDLYRASDPAVLRMLERTLSAAQAAGKPATVCGQMSSSVRYTMLLIGLGLRSFSVPPHALPELKEVLLRVSTEQCRSVAERALRLESAREIDAFLREALGRAVPELAPS